MITEAHALVLVKKGPKRIVVNERGDAVPLDRGRALGLAVDVVFVRNDGWTLGAPLGYVTVAEKLWKTDWAFRSYAPFDTVEALDAT